MTDAELIAASQVIEGRLTDAEVIAALRVLTKHLADQLAALQSMSRQIEEARAMLSRM